ncbi:interleukin-8-like [Calonectris borealis]|uniref:interleukin-8-like n=1 Tax=Calonectris borealis TaxID=1323832 RepID=UPI003F4B3E39
MSPHLRLVLLLLAAALCREMMLAAELRCHCIQTVTRLMLPKHLANVEIIPKGPHCNAVEIIATLKNSQQICLDPQAKWVKMIINRILHRAFFSEELSLRSTGGSPIITPGLTMGKLKS